MEAVKDWMSLSKSAVVGSAMGDDMEAAEVWMVRLGWEVWWWIDGVVVAHQRMKNAWKPISGCQGRRCSR
jgi:hypothetical protein